MTHRLTPYSLGYKAGRENTSISGEMLKKLRRNRKAYLNGYVSGLFVFHAKLNNQST